MALSGAKASAKARHHRRGGGGRNVATSALGQTRCGDKRKDARYLPPHHALAPRGAEIDARRARYDGAVARNYRFWLAFVVVPALLIVGGVSFLGWRQSAPGVRADFEPPPRYLGLKTPIALTLTAARSGVASAELRLVQGQGRVVLARQTFSGGAGQQRIRLTVEGPGLGLREGGATLEVFARDGFWRPLRVDDRPVLTLPVTLDLTPPSLEVVASTRYLAQGGGGLVVFRAKGAARLGANAGGSSCPPTPSALRTQGSTPPCWRCRGMRRPRRRSR
jgi:hypothetical protein